MPVNKDKVLAALRARGQYSAEHDDWFGVVVDGVGDWWSSTAGLDRQNFHPICTAEELRQVLIQFIEEQA